MTLKKAGVEKCRGLSVMRYEITAKPSGNIKEGLSCAGEHGFK